MHDKSSLSVASGSDSKSSLLPEFEQTWSVTFDQEVPCLTIIWKAYATSQQLRHMHENLLSLIAEFKVSKILGDDTALPIIHAENQVWIARDWLPRAAQAGLKVAANKTPAAHFGRLAVEGIKQSQTQVRLRSFHDLNEARRWLKDQ